MIWCEEFTVEIMMVWRIHCRDNDAKDGNDGVKNSL